MATTYDVFMSHAHADGARVKPLVQALRARGLQVWFDETEIATFEGITRSISDGLANAKALIGLYSDLHRERLRIGWQLHR
jgi:hypothetical protein